MAVVFRLLLCLTALPQAPAEDARIPTGPDWEEVYGERWTPEAQVYRLAGPSVVRVDVFGMARRNRGPFAPPGPPESTRLTQGTGVVIDPAGLVITNAHVAVPEIRGVPAESINLQVSFASDFGGETLPAQVLNFDRESDLALLKIDSEKAFRAVPIGTSRDLIPGEPVIAIGTPFGNSHSITSGILSGQHRDVPVQSPTGTVQNFSDILQTDAAINPGNSGGPLLNVHGQLIGINFATNQRADNIGFAIPVDRMLSIFAERLLDVDRSDRFWAGMRVEEVDGGLRITMVHPRGPAAAAGLRPGDRLLTVDGERVRTQQEYAGRLLVHQPDDQIALRIARDDRQHLTSMQLRPALDRDMVGLLGFRVKPDYLVLRNSRFRRADRVSVLRITEVFPGTGAERLGVEPGDILVAVRLRGRPEADAWMPVRGLADLVAYLRGPDFYHEGENIWLLRGDQSYRGKLVLDDPTVLISG